MLNQTALALLTAVALQGAPADSTGGVQGVITGLQSSGSEAVAHASVDFVGAWGTETVRTDQRGRYQLDSIPAGTAVVRFSHIGFHDHVVEVNVRAGETVRLDVELRSRPVALAPVRVGWRRVERPGTTRAEASPRMDQSMEVEVTAAQLGLADPGLVAAARNAPPGEGDRPGEVLFMRGSTTDLRRVLLDGVPVFSPFHVAGLLPSFHGELLGEAGAFVGGAPSRYDGSLSQVLDLRTRAPRRDQFRTGGSVDGMSGRLTLEGPLGPTGGFAVAGRALHDLQPRLVDEGRSPYGYKDALVRVQEWIAQGHRLAFTGFWNRESVRLDPDRAQERLGRTDLIDAAGESAAPSEAVWSNRAGSFRYTGRWGSTWTEVTVGRSLYRAALPLNLEDPVFVRGWTGQRRVGVDVARNSGEWEVRTGAALARMDLTFQAPGFKENGNEDARGREALAAQPAGGPDGGGAVASDVPSRDEDDVLGARARSVGGYLEGQRPLGDDFAITMGGRLEYFSNGDIHLSPRVSGEWRLTEDAVLTLTGGRYHQLVPADDDEALADALRRDSATQANGWEPRMDVASAHHVVTSLGQDLTRRLRLDISAFAKRFDGLPEAEDGRMNSSGVDVRVVRMGERVGGWLGYNLGWFWSGAREFSGRHLVAGGVAGSLGGWADARLSTVYGAGLPYTGVPLLGDDGSPSERGGGVRALSVSSVDEGSPLPTEPMDDFLRVDLELTGEWDMDLRSRTTTLRPYVKVLNALDRRDALFVYFDDWRDDGARPLAERPIVPLLGVEWSF